MKLVIYDIGGRQVRILVNCQQQAGNHQIVWDGIDDHNMAVAVGVYFCRMAAAISVTSSPNKSSRVELNIVKVIKLALVK